MLFDSANKHRYQTHDPQFKSVMFYFSMTGVDSDKTSDILLFWFLLRRESWPARLMTRPARYLNISICGYFSICRIFHIYRYAWLNAVEQCSRNQPLMKVGKWQNVVVVTLRSILPVMQFYFIRKIFFLFIPKYNSAKKRCKDMPLEKILLCIGLQPGTQALWCLVLGDVK